jgi:hypothetical protein
VMKHDMACSCMRENNNLEAQGQNGYCNCNGCNGQTTKQINIWKVDALPKILFSSICMYYIVFIFNFL